MKNTAPRVGVAGGAGGRRTRPPREAQGRKPRAGQGATPAPRAGQKMSASGGRSGRGAGRQTSGYRTEGKRPDTLHAKHRASRKKPAERHRCADRRESPAGACPLARRTPPPQEPDKGNRPTRADKPTRPDGRLCYARRTMAAKDNRQQGNKSGGTRNRQNRRSDDRAAGARRQHAPDAAPTRAAAEPTRPTERNKLPSGAQGEPSATKEQGARARPALTYATTAPHGIDLGSTSDRHRIAIASTSILRACNAGACAFRPRVRGGSPLFIGLLRDLCMLFVGKRVPYLLIRLMSLGIVQNTPSNRSRISSSERPRVRSGAIYRKRYKRGSSPS